MRRLIFCLGVVAGLVPVSNGQNFPTNSTIERAVSVYGMPAYYSYDLIRTVSC